MKKMILLFCLAASAFYLQAQTPTYTAPRHILVTFQRDYPDVITAEWAPMKELWRASYRSTNRLKHVFYYPNGQSYSKTLPVIVGHVAEPVIKKAIDLAGNDIYDITKLKMKGNTEVYKIRVISNDSSKIIWMNEEGKDVSDQYK